MTYVLALLADDNLASIYNRVIISLVGWGPRWNGSV